jgi:uncharacterized membrane protein
MSPSSLPAFHTSLFPRVLQFLVVCFVVVLLTPRSSKRRGESAQSPASASSKAVSERVDATRFLTQEEFNRIAARR